MGLLIELSVQFCLESQKTVYLGHGITPRVKRTICLYSQDNVYAMELLIGISVQLLP